MNQSLVQITDSSGQVVGSSDMMAAFDQQLIRNTVYVMLRDQAGRYLLQKRSDSVPNFPGWWDASAGGHVDEGEAVDSAAKRELVEELGIYVDIVKKSDFYFEAHDDYKRLYRYYVHFYEGTYDGSGIDIDQQEVAAVDYFSVEQLETLDRLTPIARRLVGSA